ncbi:MAG: DUF885 domain-containing protein [Polyangiaceae bacterium]|nr:DUF885 domain-containing protein [Polyangiaceae bacterium]
MMPKTYPQWVAVVGFLLLPSALPACSSNAEENEVLDDESSLKGEAAKQIVEDVFAELTRHKPTFAVFGTDGDRSHDREMDPISPSEFSRFYTRMRQLGKQLAKIDPAKLDASYQLAYDIATLAVKDAESREVSQYETWEMSILYDEGDDLPYYSSVGPIRNRADFDNLLARYKQLTGYFDQKIANYKRGLANNRVAPKAIVTRVIEKNKGLYSAAGEQSAMVSNLTFAEGVSSANQTAWKAEMAKLVDSTINVAGMKWVTFLETMLLPQARTKTFGVGTLDVGAKLYAGQVLFNTGESRTPEALHTLGLSRVAELEQNMQKELRNLGIQEITLAKGLEKAKALPASQPGSAADIKTRVEQNLMPKLTAKGWAENLWGVAKPAPVKFEYPEREGSAVFLLGVNAIRVPVKGVSLPSIDSVLVHEYTHHLQGLVASASKPVSPVQQFFGSSAMAEGGGLFSEVVALEQNLYGSDNTPAASLTRLNAYSNLMLRAVRLVVDTGIHAKDWSRQKAIDYMRVRLTMGEEAVAYEVDRYASVPAQALSYRVGLEAILSSRDRAQKALGSKYNPAAFANMVLGTSGASAAVLPRKTDALIAASK